MSDPGDPTPDDEDEVTGDDTPDEDEPERRWPPKGETNTIDPGGESR